MSYKSDIELMHQIGILEDLIKNLVSKAERIAELRAEGKVSDSAYGAISNELRRRVEIIERYNNELFPMADASLKQMNSESLHLKHQLEFLEVRHAIDSIPDDQYKVIREGIYIQLADMEQTKKRLDEIMTAIGDCSRRVGQFVSGKVEEAAVLPKFVEPDAMPTVSIESKPNAMPIQAPMDSNKPKAKICSNCQAVNRENALYCYSCGSKL